MSPVASFHLVREARGRQLVMMARLGLDRRRVREVDGLTFARTLGTGRGSRTGPSIDARRSAVFAVWSDVSAYDRFMTSHPLPQRWRDAHEAWHVRLDPVRCRGRWDGVDLGLGAPDARLKTTTGPVAVLTRASVRPGATVAFLRASRSSAGAAAAATGNLAVVGIGERPLGRLGTFSLWVDERSARDFALTDERHRAAMNAARSGRWFSEELFAVFSPTASTGTWADRDPLAGQTA